MTFSPINNSEQDNNKPKKDEEFIKIAQGCIEEIFEAAVAEKMNPLFLKNRTLTISCSNQEIAEKVRENQNKIIKKINVKLGTKEVDRIRYLL
jgi:hypothetical protein